MKQTVLITGCSSGIGFHTAIRLARTFHVVAIIRNPAKMQALESAIVCHNLPITMLHADITSEADIQKCAALFQTNGWPLDVLINNAGYGLGGCFEELEEDEIRAQFETNFFGTLRVTQHFLPRLKASPQGKIITITSGFGRFSAPGVSAYCATKFALEGFFEALRYELLADHIQVILVAPGAFDTPILAENARYAQVVHTQTESRSQRVCDNLKRLFFRRPGHPEKVAKQLEKICLAKRPRFRYLVGADALYGYWLTRCIPQPVLDAVFGRIAR